MFTDTVQSSIIRPAVHMLSAPLCLPTDDLGAGLWVNENQQQNHNPYSRIWRQKANYFRRSYDSDVLYINSRWVNQAM